jgi:hypothetical protein
MLKYLNPDEKQDGKYFFPLQMRDFLQSDKAKRLVTDSPERSFYDIYSAQSADVFVPRPASLPFNEEYVASTNFTNNALSLSTLQSKTDEYNYLHEVVPSLAGLQRPSFVGLTQGDVRLEVGLEVPEAGTYRVLLHGGSKGDTITAMLGNQEVSLQKITADQNQPYDYLDITYFYADIPLEKGAQKLSVHNTNQAAVIVDSVTLVPTNEIPKSFDAWLIPTDKEFVYDIRLE